VNEDGTVDWEKKKKRKKKKNKKKTKSINAHKETPTLLKSRLRHVSQTDPSKNRVKIGCQWPAAGFERYKQILKGILGCVFAVLVQI
jgi:hypothetical protein